MEEIFRKVVQVNIRCRDCDERKAHICVTIDLVSRKSAVHKRDLQVRLTDDTDPFFLYNLILSEEDFQSLKIQQGLVFEFISFPKKLIDLLHQCQSEENSSHPSFKLLLSCDSASLDGPAHLSVVQSNSFKEINFLSLRLTKSSDKNVKVYLAACLSSLKDEKEALEVKLQKTEDDLSSQLNNAQQMLSEKSKELDRLRSEWAHELQSERVKAAELQERLQQQMQQRCQDLESEHKRTSQQTQSRLTELETSCRELTDMKYKNKATIMDLKSKLACVEEECQSGKQLLASQRRENDSLDATLQGKERLTMQLQRRLDVLEQEVKDKKQLLCQTKEKLKETQQQKQSIQVDTKVKENQIQKLEAARMILSEDVNKGNEIIRKFQWDLENQMGKLQLRDKALENQEKVLQDTSAKLKMAQNEARHARQELSAKDERILNLEEQLESSVQKLAESKEALQNKENVVSVLNRQLTKEWLSKMEPKLSENTSAALTSAGLRVNQAHFYPHALKAAVTPDAIHNYVTSECAGGLDTKYFERSDDSIPVYGFPSPVIPRADITSHKFPPPPSKAPVASAYFPC
ncbi:spindle assembly abnormal protein 6 homolog isoform X1 [Phycodurus eques]|uniref:spindle assembly abnormal protein 6 homolog isoform X1 n=1 Tax=Phycodurus eques TaxID=693459 RepID=UPI002ACE385E|nr:spindle assembly abnormal protein 6 homolog isoform X1 [Phycodurus eques]XP_061535450.1 spindle assembly abnormal protein 6 homolog isoform X1 [Phycodurus eques]